MDYVAGRFFGARVLRVDGFWNVGIKSRFEKDTMLQ
jgi:hypothetical protein